jgi:hypothetical protein
MKNKREFYCLVCRKTVGINPIGITVAGVIGQKTCSECGSPSIIDLKETSPEEFEKLVKKFKEQTGEV